MVFIARVAATVATVITVVQGHFTFVRLAHNGVWQEPTRYIRNKTAPFEDTYFGYPNGMIIWHHYGDPTNYINLPESVRCGRDNMAHAPATDVLHVNAGDEIEFAHSRHNPEDWTDDLWYNCPEGRGTCRLGVDMPHPGPVLAHLGKVPDGVDVREYDGSGEWTKIYTLGFEYRKDQRDPIHWLAYNNNTVPVPRFTFKIPPQTPSGQYLLRIDLVYAYEHPGSAQMYPSCAHLSVSGTSTSEFPTGVKIPEIFSPESPGMIILNDEDGWPTMSPNYTFPGGPLWDGGKLVIDKPVYKE